MNIKIELISLAASKGFKFDTKKGIILGVRGRPLVMIKGGPKNKYRYFPFCTAKADGFSERKRFILPVHVIFAYLKFGNVVFQSGIRIQHKNGIHSDNRAANLRIRKIKSFTKKPKDFNNLQEKVANSLYSPFVRKAAEKYIGIDFNNIEESLEEGDTLTSVSKDYNLSFNTVKKISLNDYMKWNLKYFIKRK